MPSVCILLVYFRTWAGNENHIEKIRDFLKRDEEKVINVYVSCHSNQTLRDSKKSKDTIVYLVVKTRGNREYRRRPAAKNCVLRGSLYYRDEEMI